MGGVVSEGRAPGIASDGAGVCGFVRGGGAGRISAWRGCWGLAYCSTWRG